MPKTFNTRIWGKHFCIESRFNYNPVHGYKLAGKQKRFRIPRTNNPVQLEHVKLERTDLSLHMQENLWKAHEQAESSLFATGNIKPSFFKSVSASLKQKITMLELNFDGFNFYSGDEVRQNRQDLAKITDSKEFLKLTEELKLDFDHAYTSLLHDPVIPEDLNSRNINKNLFHFLNKNLPGKLPLSDVVVISGELVWSKWLDLYSIIELIRAFKLPYQQFVIDSGGIWQLLMHVEGRSKELLQLNKSCFEPNFTYISEKSATKSHKGFLEVVLHKKSKEKKLFITPERSGLFWLDDVDYEADKRKFTDLVFFDFYPPAKAVLNEDKEFQEWFKSEAIENELYAEYKIFDLPLTFNSVTQNKIAPGGRIELIGGLKIGDRVRFGQDFAFIRAENEYLLETKYKGDALKKMLKVSAGEYVKKGDKLTEASGLLGKIESSVRAPEQGMVDFTYVNDGVIVIRKQLTKQLLTAPFDSEISGVEKSGAVYLKAETMNLPLEFFQGKSSGGLLSKTGTANNDIEQILLLEGIKDFKLSYKEIIELKVRGVIFYAAGYQELVQFISRESKKLKLLNLMVVGQFGKKVNAKLRRLLESNVGNYIFSEDYLLKFPVVTDKLAIGYARPAKILAKEAGLNKGNSIRFASYKLEDTYARIENVQNSYCVIVASDNVSQIAKDNILSEL